MSTDLTTETNGGDIEGDVNIIEFVVGTSRTINLGNFESLKIEASVTVEVHEGDNLADLRAAAQKELRKLLEETYIAQHRIKT
jgi:hypothetical protein